MKVHLLVLCVAVLPAAVWTLFETLQPKAVRDEKWLESRVATSVPGYTLEQSREDPKVSYKMDATTYNELDPLGIAAQVFDDGKGGKFEAVVIAGDNMATFHDQRICFMSQGWNLVKNETGSLVTVQWGHVPDLDLEVSKAGQGSHPALFMWRSPLQFANDRRVAKTDFFMEALRGRPALVGYSYRFMGVSDGVDSASLAKFAGAYLDATRKAEDAVSRG